MLFIVNCDLRTLRKPKQAVTCATLNKIVSYLEEHMTGVTRRIWQMTLLVTGLRESETERMSSIPSTVQLSGSMKLLTD